LGLVPGDALVWSLEEISNHSDLSEYREAYYLHSDSINPQYSDRILISHNGRWLATLQEATVHLWDLTDASKPPYVLLHGMTRGMNDFKFSSNNRWLATASNEFVGETVILWDLENDPVTGIPLLYDQQTLKIDFVADDKFLLADNHLISLNIDELKKIACHIAGRNLSTSEWQNYFPEQPYRPTCSQIYVFPG